MAITTIIANIDSGQHNPTCPKRVTTASGVPFAGPLTASVTVFADDITVIVSRRLDIKTVKKVVGEYEQRAGA